MKLLNINEVAALLSVSRRTVEYWESAGRLPGFVRLYGNRRWRADAIEAWAAADFPDLEVCKSTQPEKNASTSETISGESTP